MKNRYHVKPYPFGDGWVVCCGNDDPVLLFPSAHEATETARAANHLAKVFDLEQSVFNEVYCDLGGEG